MPKLLLLPPLAKEKQSQNYSLENSEKNPKHLGREGCIYVLLNFASNISR